MRDKRICPNVRYRISAGIIASDTNMFNVELYGVYVELEHKDALRGVLEKLEAEVREQEATLIALENEIERKVRLIDGLKLLLAEWGLEGNRLEHRTAARGVRPERRQGNPNSLASKVRHAARLIIQTEGRPMTQRAIKLRIEEMGLIDGDVPVDSIRIYLSRANDEFTHVKGQGFILVDGK